MSKMHYFL